MKLTLKRWLLCWGALALVAPTLLTLRWVLFHSLLGRVEATFWPGSFILMSLEATDRVIPTVLLWGVAFLANVAVYCVLGLAVWAIVQLATRASQLF